MFIYGRRSPEAEALEGAKVVMVSVVGSPDGPDTAHALVDHEGKGFPGATAMVRLPDNKTNRADLIKTGGYWGWTPGAELLSGVGIWEWHGMDAGDEGETVPPAR